MSTGIFFLDLLNGIKPGYVDYSLVTSGRDAEEKKQNGMHTRRGISFHSLNPVLLISEIGYLNCQEAERAYFPCSGR